MNDAIQIRKELEQSMSTLQNFLRSPDGLTAIKCLEVKYSGNLLIQGDPYATHTRIGERGVLDYLTELRDGENV